MQEAEGKLDTLRTSLKVMPLVVQITKAPDLKDLQQCVTKKRECQKRHTTQLDEQQDIGAQISMKAVSVMQVVLDGRRDVIDKIVEHPLEREVIECRETNEKIKEQVKEVTQQYKEFKVNISGYTISS